MNIKLNIMRKIAFKWNEKTDKGNYARVGAMYCFKRCDVNVN